MRYHVVHCRQDFDADFKRDGREITYTWSCPVCSRPVVIETARGAAMLGNRAIIAVMFDLERHVHPESQHRSWECGIDAVHVGTVHERAFAAM